MNSAKGPQGSDASAAHSWRCGHIAGALGSGSAPDAGLSLSGCYGDAIASPPPGSLGEGGRDRGHQEKPGLQSLKQRNPRSWLSASGAEAVGGGAGACQWALGRRVVAASASGLRDALETRLSAPCFLYSVHSRPTAGISFHPHNPGRMVEIHLPLYTGKTEARACPGSCPRPPG